MKIRSRYGFTLLELLVTIMILSVLVSGSVAMFGKFRDRAAMLVDETNMKILLAAAKLYAYDNNALPGNLSELRTQDVERAYALVTEGKRPYTFLVFLQEWVALTDVAEAGVIDKYLPGNENQILKIKTCPLSTGSISYGIIHPSLSGSQTELQWLLDKDHANAVVIVETNATDASTLAYRHEGGRTCMQVLNSGVVQKKSSQ